MPNYVPGIGNSHSTIAIVGEAPGGQEDAAGIPFVGPSGKILDELLEEVGIDRNDVWMTNVCKYRPPSNDLKRLSEIGISLEDQKKALYRELTEVNPNIIVALGATALEALTGKNAIRSYRGSILKSNLGIKVVPTLHPATLLYSQEMDNDKPESAINYGVAKLCLRHDLTRAKNEQFTKELNLPRRNLRIIKDALALYRFIDQYKNEKYLSVDIESFKSIPYCIGLAFNSFEGVSVPLLNTKYLRVEQHQIVLIWQELAQILKSFPIIGQNLKYDQGSLRRECGFEISNVYADTMLMASVLGPEMPKSLAFLTSIYTREPYYKDEGKEFNLKVDKIDRLLHYNANDAVVTHEVAEEQIKELEETGLKDFYFNFVHRLHDLYYRIERRGILRDEIALKELKDKYNKEYDTIEAQFHQQVGPVNPDSPKQIKKLLYETLNIPTRKDTGVDTIVALLNNTVKKQETKDILINILKLRRIGKLIGTYLDAKTDEDGRIRTSYKITGTETGRTSTSILKPPVRYEKRGIAFQTMSKHGEVGSDLRRIFIPDPGYVFVEADLSQAEARVVAVLAKDNEMLRMFDERDIHKVTAGWVFQCRPEFVTEEQRAIGKMTRHAGNYDAGKRELMRKAESQAQKSGTALRISEWRAGICLDTFHQKSPNIRKVFHKDVADHLSMYRTLVNPFGRLRTFFGRYDHDLLKEGYAQIPQSTVSDQLKWAMLKCTDEWPNLWINLEAHDAFMCMVRPDEVKDLTILLKKHLESPIDFTKCSLKREVQLTIPCDIKVGDNWKEMVKYDESRTHESNDKTSGILEPTTCQSGAGPSQETITGVSIT